MAYLFDPKSKEPFKISRTKVMLYLECPRCFYMDQRLGIKRPSGPGFSLNSAVDELLKKEFNIHRANETTHPLMKTYGINAIPADHEKLDLWRHNFTGVRFFQPETNFELYGSIDDLWLNNKGEYHVVDYKATSTTKKISLDDEYKQGYKKQIEFYIWLLRKNNFKISNIAYFVFCNGLKDREAFDGKLEFDLSIIEYLGDTSWIEPAVLEAKKVLMANTPPSCSDSCEYCQYNTKASSI